MATQGLLSIVDKQGKVVLKVVVGCDGMNIPKLAKALRKDGRVDPQSVHKICRKQKVGCDSCLVVASPDTIICGEGEDKDEIEKKYRVKFNDPNWNPRWDFGTADYTEIIKL
jgi:hypothetical protein